MTNSNNEIEYIDFRFLNHICHPILKKSAETKSIKTTFPRFFCAHFAPPQPDYEARRVVRARGVEFVETRRRRTRLVRRQRLHARRLCTDETQMPHDGIRAEILRCNPETLSCALSRHGNFAQRRGIHIRGKSISQYQ